MLLLAVKPPLVWDTACTNSLLKMRAWKEGELVQWNSQGKSETVLLQLLSYTRCILQRILTRQMRDFWYPCPEVNNDKCMRWLYELQKVLGCKKRHNISYNFLNCGCQLIFYVLHKVSTYVFNVTNMHSFSESNE